jgi:hypothetical protein
LNRRRTPVLAGIVTGMYIGHGGALLAQGQAPPSPPIARYPLPRYEEDWRHLQGEDRREDVWDPVKFIPLTADGGDFLSLGGEARETYERFHNPDFGLAPASPDGYLLERYLLHADAHWGSRVRVWAELISALEHGRVGGPRPVIDKDPLDLHQAFVDIALSPTSTAQLQVTGRFGRQEIALGSGRMYALREGPNVPLSFDGVRLSARTGTWRFDGWAARPVANKSGVFDNTSQAGFGVWGVYATHHAGPAPTGIGAEAYYLGLERRAARFDQGIADEMRHTAGARLWRQGAWGYDCEGMFQFGRFGSGDIRAWRMVAEGSYVKGAAAWKPRFDLVADIASGDKDRADPNLETFNALFQSGTYSGRAQLLGPSNAIRFEPSVTLTLSPSVSLAAGWGFFWRQSIHDGLYGISGQLIVPSHGAPGRYEGSRPIAQIDWQITRHLSAHLNYIYVFNGAFEEASVHGTTSLGFVSPWITYRF